MRAGGSSGVQFGVRVKDQGLELGGVYGSGFGGSFLRNPEDFFVCLEGTEPSETSSLGL